MNINETRVFLTLTLFRCVIFCIVGVATEGFSDVRPDRARVT